MVYMGYYGYISYIISFHKFFIKKATLKLRVVFFRFLFLIEFYYIFSSFILQYAFRNGLRQIKNKNFAADNPAAPEHRRKQDVCRLILFFYISKA